MAGTPRPRLLLAVTLALAAPAAGASAAPAARASAAAAGAAALPTRAPGPQATAAGRRPAVYGPALLRELNRVRGAHGLPALVLDARMSRGAHAHSADMTRRHYFSHGAWSARVARAAGRPRSLGEVLGFVTQSSAATEARWLVRSWLASPEHRAAVLGASFRRVGIGRSNGSYGGATTGVYTVDFASPR